MAKKSRQTLKLFGDSGGTSNFGQFGSQAAASPVTTKAIATIQALAAFDDGWQEAVALGQAPYLQDMNALFYVLYYESFYLFQEGIPEYDSGTTYWIGSFVKKTGTMEIYVSRIDTNLGHALPSSPGTNTQWALLGIVGATDGSDAIAGNVGEAIRSYVASGSAVNGVNSQYVDVTSIDLTAGDWDVSGIVDVTLNSATCTVAAGGIWQDSGNVSTHIAPGDNYYSGPPPTAAYDTAISIPCFRVNISSPTTYYLKAFIAFSAGTPKAFGRISARRVR